MKMNMIINGKHTNADVKTENIDASCVQQIQNIADNPIFEGTKIVLMPDCHAGKGCCVGFTQTITDKICPNLVGVDIGCGMLTLELSEDISTDDFLNACKKIPVGGRVNGYVQKDVSKLLLNLHTDISDNANYLKLSIGSLGGGNHFIELNQSENTGKKYIVIHTGSRYLGILVCKYWLNRAIGDGDLKYLTSNKMLGYLDDMKIAQKYAEINRIAISEMLGFKYSDAFETVHNYIDMNDMILRKGSISATKGKKCLIPLNMRDGSLVCEGLGNADWNYSAPHGSGRLMSRSKARKTINLLDYQETMKNVASNSVCSETIDESPFAYKDSNEIESLINGKCVNVLDHLKVLANHKGF